MIAHGLILFAHGSRDPNWAKPFEAVADAVRLARPGLPVRLAFLEAMQPDLLQAAGQLQGAGCTRVEVLPLFLGSGAHVRRDLSALVEQLRARYPRVVWALHASAGESPIVARALRDAALALLPDEAGAAPA